ncbi:hypothetical protein [Archangium violaceum]|uniref:hypothetical protein n=1 Tax=Archangium violaceum TaxID=83451 RepID=UPI0036DF24A1
MDGEARIIEVDGQRFRVRFEPLEGSLEVETSGGEPVRLLAFRFDAYLAALDRHVYVGAEGLSFDPGAFSREVLEHSGVPVALFAELSPLALWWAAAGSGAGPRAPTSDGWVDVGSARVQLRPWTWVRRGRALSASVSTRDDGTRALSLERYLREMLSASVVATDPSAFSLESLSGPETAALIDAAVAMNIPGERLEDQLSRSHEPEGQALAHLTLRLCKALGWTPSQVWETPAAEVDRLLSLLDVVEVPAPAAALAGASGLASHPDAVVIQVEEG